MSAGARRRWRLGCAASILLAVAAGLLAGRAHGADADLMRSVIVADESRKEAVGHAIVWLGDPAVLIPLLLVACAIAWRRRDPLAALGALVVVLGANATTQLLKFVLSHPRPDAILSGREINPSSFPSGHVTAVAATAFAFAIVVGPRWRAPVGAVGAAATLAVGLAVVALTWHYPTDVAGAIFIALAWGCAVVGAQPVKRESAGSA